MLTVTDLHVSFNGPPAVHAVRGMDFEVSRGEALGIVGEFWLRQERSGTRVARLASVGHRIRVSW